MRTIARPLVALAVAGTVLIAFVLYELKTDTRQLAQRARALEARIERLKAANAVLEAEWSSLRRPHAIDRLAREKLGLRPTEPAQYITPAELPPLRRPKAYPKVATSRGFTGPAAGQRGGGR